MSDWDKIISFSNSKQGGAIQFILLCVILVIMFGSYFRNQMGGGKQRGGSGVTWFLTMLFGIIVLFCLYVFFDFVINKK